MNVLITSQVAPTFVQINPLCQNGPAPTLPATSTNGVTGTWSPATINTSTVGSTTHTFTPNAGQCGIPTTMNIVVASQVGPTFTTIGPLCENSTPPQLPTTSTNGISGTWSPSVINTSIVGTTAYTFTQAAGQCAKTVTLNITVNPRVTPTFSPIGPLCQNSSAPTLPATSTNGITGTWSPGTINTSTPGTTNYTFTPSVGLCAETVTLSITITSQVPPTFTQIGPLCQNSSAPAMPTVSTNGISGSWSPSNINTATIGTTSYTFTPAAGQCGRIVTMIINIIPVVTPNFNPIGPLCQNSIASNLPATSIDGISGTWSPSTINTANAGTTTYTFTPLSGQCATTTTLSITVNPQVSLTFDPIGPFCQNSTAAALPKTSLEGISGTWTPATINTQLIGTTTYRFTPASSQCGIAATIDIEITSQITPNFTPIRRLCQNSNPPTLPKTSLDGFTGMWSPDTINTSKIGITSYIFTPAAGQCGTSTTMNIEITNQVTPIFVSLGPLCENSPGAILPTTSTNGIIGNWNPATINTSTVGTSNYVFTPTANQCGTPTTMDVFIISQNTPTFNQVGPLCQNSVPPQLPTTSNNGITGTWSPAAISTDTAGTKTYTFTPIVVAGQCAATTTMDITVKPSLSSSTTITICTNQLPYSWNGQTFTSAGTYNVKLLSSLGCDSIATLKLVVNNFLTSTTKVSICPSQLPYSWNGTSYTAAGTYNITLQNARGCDSVVSLVLAVNQVLTSLTEVSVCSNELPYSWNGEKFDLEGTYSKKLKTQSGCDSVATLKLTLEPISTAYITGNARICAGMTSILNLNLSGPGPWDVVYSDGDSLYTIDSITVTPYKLTVSPKVTTTYTIKSVGNSKCFNTNLSNSFTVSVIDSEKGIRYSTEYALPNQPKQLTARKLGSGYITSWNPIVGLNEYSISNPEFNYNKSTEYTVTLRSNIGCVTVDTVQVKIIPDTSVNVVSEIFVPKAFTPNNDGKNDLLLPFPSKIKELKYFRVYNRWGQLMFETNQLLKGWNGMYNGKPQVMDSYSWTAEAIGFDGKTIKRSGNSALLR
jgi:gliding motility-associated-like protein